MTLRSSHIVYTTYLRMNPNHAPSDCQKVYKPVNALGMSLNLNKIHEHVLYRNPKITADAVSLSLLLPRTLLDLLQQRR